MKGAVIKRGDDKWLVRIFIGRDANGKRNYYSEMVTGKKKVAEGVLTEKLHEQNRGKLIAPAKHTLNEHLEEWLKTVRRKVSERTWEHYDSLLRSHVENTIGRSRLCDIEKAPSSVQKLYDTMLDDGYSPKTIRSLHNVLNQAFDKARQFLKIAENPCDLCELPKKKHKEMVCFERAEARMFLKAAKEDKYYAALLLAIETGMRPEEYLGLKWRDIDFDQGRLSVRRALIPKKGGGYEFAETKTEKSRRNIPLSPTVMDALKAHRRVQLEERMRIADVYRDEDIVFASVIGTPLQHNNFVRRHYHTTLDRANKMIRKENETRSEPISELPRIHLYALRHSMASIMLAQGVHLKVVSERLGHADITLTANTYSHVSPGIQQDATDQMDALLHGS